MPFLDEFTPPSLGLSPVGQDQRDARDERESAHDGRQGDVVLFGRCNLKRPQIDDFIPGRVLDSAID